MTEPVAAVARLAVARDVTGELVVGELVPVLRRAAALDPHAVARFRLDGSTATVFVRLPFEVLVSRRVRMQQGDTLDVTLGCADALAWYDGERRDLPEPKDLDWRSALPPTQGWQLIEVVPDAVVRDLVRRGSLALADMRRGESAHAEPRPDVVDALLGSVVLTVSSEQHSSADITLRALSALTRMGFVARGSKVAVSVAGRWIRLAAEFGSVYLERPGSAVGLMPG